AKEIGRALVLRGGPLLEHLFKALARLGRAREELEHALERLARRPLRLKDTLQHVEKVGLQALALALEPSFVSFALCGIEILLPLGLVEDALCALNGVLAARIGLLETPRLVLGQDLLVERDNERVGHGAARLREHANDVLELRALERLEQREL